MGDLVMMKNRGQVMNDDFSASFDKRWFGPFAIKNVITDNIVEIETKDKNNDFDCVYHVSELKPYIGEEQSN